MPQSIEVLTMSGETLTPRILLSHDGQGSFKLSAGGESSYCPALLAKSEKDKMLLVVPVTEADGSIAAFATSLNFVADKLNPKHNQFSTKVCLPNPTDLSASDGNSCSFFALAKKALGDDAAKSLTHSSNIMIKNTLDDKLFGSRRGVAFVAGILPAGRHNAQPMQVSPTNTGCTDVAGHKVATLQFSVELQNPGASLSKGCRVARLAVAQEGGHLGQMGTDLTEFLQVLGLIATGAPMPEPATPVAGMKRPHVPPSTDHRSANRATARRLAGSQNSDHDADPDDKLCKRLLLNPNTNDAAARLAASNLSRKAAEKLAKDPSLPEDRINLVNDRLFGNSTETGGRHAPSNSSPDSAEVTQASAARPFAFSWFLGGRK